MSEERLSRVALREEQKRKEQELKQNKSNFDKKPNKRKIKLTKKQIVLIILLAILAFIIGWFVMLGNNFSGTKTDFKGFQETKKNIGTDSALTLVLGVDGLNQKDLKSSSDVDDRRGIRSDSIMLVATNPNKNEVKTVSVYRDLLITDACTGYQDKLNATFANGWTSSTSNNLQDRIANGAKCMKKTLENYFGLPINNYMVVNFSGFEKVIDAVGGVDIDVMGGRPKGTKFCEQDKWSKNGNPDESSWDQGKYCFVIGTKRHLNGEEALAYSRHRHSDDDRWRTMRQSQVLGAIVKSMKSPLNIAALPFNTSGIEDAFTTNISSGDGATYMLRHLFGLSSMKVQRLDLRYEDDIINGIYYLDINKEDKLNAIEQLKQFLN